MATEQEGHTPWGVEQTENMLWIGPMRPDGCKVDQVVCGLNYDRDLTVSAKLRQLQIAYLIAAAPDLLEALKFYADEEAWNQPPIKTVHHELLGPAYENAASMVRRDSGKIARASIARATGEA